MIDVEEYQELKASVEESKENADRAIGAYQETVKQIKKNYDVKGIVAAKKKLASLKSKAAKKEKVLEEKLKAFQIKWQEHLEAS